MLYVPSSRFAQRTDNWGTNPSNTPGTSITPGASNAEGSWILVLTATANLWGLYVRVSDGRTATQQKDHLLDIGTDPAGGSSYTARISNIVCGATTNTSAALSGQNFFFPIFIPSGATIAARIQGNNATAGTVFVQVRAYGYASRPSAMPAGQYSETIGTITDSAGVTFTPATNAFGSWVSLGTTTRDLWWWQVGYGISNATLTNERTYIELGVGDATNKATIIRLVHSGSTNEDAGSVFAMNLLWHECYYPVKAGAELWVRGNCDSASPDTGYHAVAVGIGG